MSTYTWTFGTESAGLEFAVVYDTEAETFTVSSLAGSFDLNALWFSNGDASSEGAAAPENWTVG